MIISKPEQNDIRLKPLYYNYHFTELSSQNQFAVESFPTIKNVRVLTNGMKCRLVYLTFDRPNNGY